MTLYFGELVTQLSHFMFSVAAGEIFPLVGIRNLDEQPAKIKQREPRRHPIEGRGKLSAF